MFKNMYTSGEYLEKNPAWHVEESPWKAKQVLRMLTQSHLHPETVCEVGCGVGEILKQLQNNMDDNCSFWGYDISPQAIELAIPRENERLHFKLADITQEKDAAFDMLLVIDVLEHLENYFSFLRDLKSKGEYKIFHIPLDLSVQMIFRRNGLLEVRESYGHIHYFTKELALQMLKELGYEVLDYFFTSSSIELPTHELRNRLMRLPRKLAFAVHRDLAARILGGSRLLILAT
ncbi:MAG TPA: methyltransferase domain-containing protein [Ktedonobacteraceae bacterium]|nr:methyltransferase domain-containing protein [Ktedonobacteraceae bacterium]